MSDSLVLDNTVNQISDDYAMHTHSDNQYSSLPIMHLNNDYFDDLYQQITVKDHWSSDLFVVFNHEAGTGKSRMTQKILGEYGAKHDDAVLYVQKFSRNNSLIETVENINKYADMQVADFVDSADNKGSKKKRREKLNAQVLVITHRMYEQVCAGKHEDIISGRQILIIDEFPDLLDRVKIEMSDISWIWGQINEFTKPDVVDEFAKYLRDTLHSYKKDDRYKQEIPFQLCEYPDIEEIIEVFEYYVEMTKNKHGKEVIERTLLLIRNGFRYHNNALNTFNNIAYQRLNNNIILDANGGIDARYSLSSLFYINYQDKFYDYSSSTLTHYVTSTSKDALSSYINLFEKAIQEIEIDLEQKTLFITDKDSVDVLYQDVMNYFEWYYPEVTENEIFSYYVAIDYFGNILGVNQYRDFDKIVILKTPNFDYIDYTLQSDFFSDNYDSRNAIKIFDDQQVESIRLTLIAGEFYQALKRINRDNQKQAQYIIFTDNEEAVELVEQTMPNINRVTKLLRPDKKRVEVEENRQSDDWLSKVKAILERYLSEERKTVTKQELREALGLEDSSNLSKYLKKLKPFMEQHNIVLKYRHIEFH